MLQKDCNVKISTTWEAGDLLFRMLKPIFGTVKVVILDSSLCVLKAMIKLRKRGIYALAAIKKRTYW